MQKIRSNSKACLPRAMFRRSGEESSSDFSSVITRLENELKKRPALPSEVSEGSVYAVKDGKFVEICEKQEQLLTINRDTEDSENTDIPQQNP